ncbi:MAG TPA: DUF6232 family protein [Actinoplanes sp.]|nr:DUF6232 family protein [Actinoplanes sp.]
MRTIYYRGPDALITAESFVWRTAEPRIFAIRDLRRVGLVQENLPDRRSGAALVAAMGMGTGAAAGWVVAGAAVGATLGLAAMITLIVAVTARQLHTVRVWQIQATYRGVVTVLYQSPDERVFNQVTRALRRAIEDATPTPTGRDLAIA